ncbi:MAG: septum formation protein Maf [Deltaproteobacteria bacterium]|nr:septum formation protein Maf [Deltaproteobacteria bacterium]MCB9788376.1 septum formation protein Maf [Deltaproteobacteria bacterium]
MSSHRRLVLASSSPYRRALLERVGLDFEVASPGVDEEALRHLAPEAMVRALATAKARAVEAADALVIGSDQALDLDGEVLGKPGTAERARAQLGRLSGRTHRLLTAVSVYDTATGALSSALDVHRMTMRRLSEEQIARYVALDAPLDCAGSYALERTGVALFERVEADPDNADDTAIIGLPMLKLLALLRRLGVDPLGPG